MVILKSVNTYTYFATLVHVTDSVNGRVEKAFNVLSCLFRNLTDSPFSSFTQNEGVNVCSSTLY